MMASGGKVLILLCSVSLALTLSWAKHSEHRHRQHHRHPHHHHHRHPHDRVEDAEPVLLEVFYETLCPNSIAFINNQLYPTIQQINSIMNVSMVPYGKATQTKDGDNWDFTCQHGPKECVGNIVESCALKYLPQNVVDPTTNIPRVLTLIHCMEMAEDPSSAGTDCAKKQDLDFSPIHACSQCSEGNQLEHVMGVRTESLNPKLTAVPWMVVNGVHNQHIQSRALYDLLGLICDTYTGKKPDACNE